MTIVAEALRLLLFVGFRKQAFIVLVMLAGAVAENVSIASLWPIFGIVSDSSQRSSPAARLVENIFATVGLQPTFGLLLVFLSATAVGKFLFSTAGGVYVGQQLADQSMRLRLDLIDAVTRARWSYLITVPQGRLTAALGDESERAAGAISGACKFVMKAFETLAYLAGCLLISWHFSAAALVVAAVLWLAVARYVRKARRAGRRKWKSTHLLSGAVADLLTSMKALRAMNRHVYLGRFASRQISDLRSSVENEFYSATAIRALQEPLLGIILIVGVYVGYRYFGLGLVDLIATAWLLRRVADGVAEMRAGIQQVAVDGCAFWSVRDLTLSLRQQAEELRPGKAAVLRSTCRFQEVTFRYGTKRIADSADFDLPLGKITTLTGRSGEGKTSIADLLVGLLEPESGRILVDDVPLAEIDLAEWRRRIGYIPQDSILFNASVLENVTLGDRSIGESDVADALKLAGAWDFVCKLPRGMRELVGVRGSLLSGGQKQRLSIARALVNRPQLLILDEATSALDAATADEICKAVRGLRGDKAILAITHQSVWMRQADTLLTLRNGKAQAGAASG